MRSFLLIIIAALLFSPQLSNAQNHDEGETGIEFFHGTWAEVLAKAKKENKPIFVDAYAVWCGPCKYMSNVVFTNGDVGDYFNENFICYKYDMEKTDGPAFANKYQVTAYPTFVFFNANGEVKYRTRGARDANGFLLVGQQAVKAMD